MADTHIDMKKIRQIFRHCTPGVGKREISKRGHISRNTVKKYISPLINGKLTYKEVNALSHRELYKLVKPGEGPLGCTPHKYVFDLFPQVGKDLKKVGYARSLIWENYKKDRPGLISCSRFCGLYRIWGYGQGPVMRLVHKAGDKLFMDFTGKKLSPVGTGTGELQELEVFVATLGASGHTHVEARRSQKREDLISCTVSALNFFGGVPRETVPDNLKSAVTKGNKYEPMINECFLSFSVHYDTTVLPARVYRPRDKALVENAVKTVYARVFAPLHEKALYSLTALNDAIIALTAKHSATDLQARKCSGSDLFESIDKPAPMPLPALSYQVRQYLWEQSVKPHIFI